MAQGHNQWTLLLTRNGGTRMAKAAKNEATTAKRETPSFTPEEFVRAWESSERISEVAEKLGTGLSNASLSARAAQYRKDGKVTLKAMTQHRGRHVDYAALQVVVDELAEKARAEQAADASDLT